MSHPYSRRALRLRLEHSGFQPKCNARAVNQFQAISLEARPCPLHTPLDSDAEVSVLADGSVNIHKLARLLVHLACHRHPKFDLPRTFACRHMIFGVTCQAKLRVHCHDGHNLLETSGRSRHDTCVVIVQHPSQLLHILVSAALLVLCLSSICHSLIPGLEGHQVRHDIRISASLTVPPWRKHLHLSKALLNVEVIRAHPIITSNARSHAVVDLEDGHKHSRRHPKARYTAPHQCTIGRAVCFRQINETSVWRRTPFPRQSVQATDHK